MSFKNIKSEVPAVSRFPLHLKKKLETQLHNISAMIEITDRTRNVLQMLEAK
jgi:hypothetical protein